jgi:quercetin dioxygenase-like cupin family protein
MEPTILDDYRGVTSFQPDRFSPVVLGGTERMKVVLTCFEAGQFIPLHAPAVDMCLVVLEGAGEVVAGQRRAAIGPGSIVIVAAGQERGIKATTRLVAVHLVTPPPTEQDHAGVQAGLGRGVWP